LSTEPITYLLFDVQSYFWFFGGWLVVGGGTGIQTASSATLAAHFALVIF
jgi:hypothetical protein